MRHQWPPWLLSPYEKNGKKWNSHSELSSRTRSQWYTLSTSVLVVLPSRKRQNNGKATV